MAKFSGDSEVRWGTSMFPLQVFVESHTNNQWASNRDQSYVAYVSPETRIRTTVERLKGEDGSMTAARQAWAEEAGMVGLADIDAADFATQFAKGILQHTTYRQRVFLIRALQEMQEKHERRG